MMKPKSNVWRYGVVLACVLVVSTLLTSASFAAANGQCYSESEATHYMNKDNCCPGLKWISACDENGLCMMSVGFCTKCGDGICKPPENKHNCPEDCNISTTEPESTIKSVTVELNQTIIETTTEPAVKLTATELEGTVVELNITKDEALHEVVIERDWENETLLLISNNISATTKEILKIKKNSLYIKTEKEEKEVKVLPDTLSETAKEVGISLIESIELKSIKEEPTYAVKGIKEGKLLAVIPVSIDIETEINADTGTIETVKKPWWDIFVL